MNQMGGFIIHMICEKSKKQKSRNYQEISKKKKKKLRFCDIIRGPDCIFKKDNASVHMCIDFQKSMTSWTKSSCYGLACVKSQFKTIKNVQEKLSCWVYSKQYFSINKLKTAQKENDTILNPKCYKNLLNRRCKIQFFILFHVRETRLSIKVVIIIYISTLFEVDAKLMSHEICVIFYIFVSIF